MREGYLRVLGKVTKVGIGKGHLRVLFKGDIKLGYG